MAPWFLYILFAVLALISLWIVASEIVRQHTNFRRTRVVSCPKTGANAEVAVEAWKAALPAAFGQPPALQVSDCSRWEQPCSCDQHCLDQIARAPEETLLRSFVAERFARKVCARCQKTFLGDDDEPIPAVLGPEGTLLEVMDIPAERLEEIIATHLPICGHCHRDSHFQAGEKRLSPSSHRVGVL